MAYKLKRPVIPQAASSFVLGRNLKQLMITLYVSARVLSSELATRWHVSNHEDILEA